VEAAIFRILRIIRVRCSIPARQGTLSCQLEGLWTLIVIRRDYGPSVVSWRDYGSSTGRRELLYDKSFNLKVFWY
jgi:hypothetical protein